MVLSVCFKSWMANPSNGCKNAFLHGILTEGVYNLHVIVAYQMVPNHGYEFKLLLSHTTEVYDLIMKYTTYLECV